MRYLLDYLCTKLMYMYIVCPHSNNLLFYISNPKILLWIFVVVVDIIVNSLNCRVFSLIHIFFSFAFLAA